MMHTTTNNNSSHHEHQHKQPQDNHLTQMFMEYFMDGMTCGGHHGSASHNDIHQLLTSTSVSRDANIPAAGNHHYAATPMMFTSLEQKSTLQQCRDDDTATTAHESDHEDDCDHISLKDLCSVSSIKACTSGLELTESNNSKTITRYNSILEVPTHVDVVRTKRKSPPIFPSDLFDDSPSESTMSTSATSDLPEYSFFERAFY